jgi:hypothetical protein
VAGTGCQAAARMKATFLSNGTESEINAAAKFLGTREQQLTSIQIMKTLLFSGTNKFGDEC